ncbi:MAG: tRNA (guanosine(37)-N1)-methyltransferase TrmD [Holosporaceae bacterium]|jgi:tRNA (guanine37-N1)-methyltransferase|nr:tRNA (guanosine(37)-N1)-methyltransferase TrmD [Holosporaceae bacterium]
MWCANVFTIFPEAFPGNLGVSNIGKALAANIWRLNLMDLKKFPAKSDRIDAIPYGGGSGMLLSPITFEIAYESLSNDAKLCKKIYFSPRGRQLQQKDLSAISHAPGITLLCGRYEGVDQRILDHYGFEEVSIGDFVLMGGEVAAMAIIEGCVRLLSGVVGEADSISSDSFQNGLLEHDQYTRPQTFRGLSVPEELLSGDHKKIREFRLQQSKKITREKRPDLWIEYVAAEMRAPWQH